MTAVYLCRQQQTLFQAWTAQLQGWQLALSAVCTDQVPLRLYFLAVTSYG